jgi:serine/threonine protein kinase/tetratricopeptide (TPR) repeat protein
MNTSPEHDERVMVIVSAALDKSEAQREAYLRMACAGNDELYREAAEVVTCEEMMGRFMLHPMFALEEPARSFRAGQIVSDRFEIIREIGEGGMGIVYEAYDRKREQRIALKFAKAGFQRLLSPELEGALSVRHPNICLVNQIHDTAIDGTMVDFIAMEFVAGEALSTDLTKRRKFPQAEALEIARQLCAGISEAHRKGVIHRDLKTNNIMLCRTVDKSLRVVIMDFGLAGALGPDSPEGGTPGYIAPELRKGEKSSFASDIYALGVILHEIVTGRKPLEVDIGNSRKPNNFPAPSSVVKGLDQRWDQVILSCLDESPSLRPSDARKVIDALDKQPINKALFVVATLLLVAPLAVPSVRVSVRDRIWPPPNVRLAVLPFAGAAKGVDMSAGVLQDVSERIRHMSSARQTVLVISPAELSEKHIVTSDEARDALHSTHVLQVKIKQEGGMVIAHCEVINLSTRTILREFTGRYSANTLGSMPAALASATSLALDLHGYATPELLSPAATPAYDRGLYLLRKDQESGDEAIASFTEAARLDPRSPLPLARLVEVKVMKFEQTDRTEVLDDARRYLELAESLGPDSPSVRLAAGLLKKTAGQYDEALDDYRRVVDLEPRNQEVLLRIAEIYDKRGMPSEAIAAYQKAIQFEPEYYAGYHGLGILYYYRGDYINAAEQFQKAVEHAPGSFDDYTNLGAALDELGRDADAENALLTSLKLRETARALNSMGAMRAYQNRDEEAVAYYRRAVVMNPDHYLYLENLADSDRRLGRTREADAAYRRARDIALGDLTRSPLNGYVRGYVAYISARLGDGKRAEDEIAQALLMSQGETKVIRHAVLTYDVLGKRNLAFEVLKGANSQMLQELSRQPDLADFRRDHRFIDLVNQNSTGGK